jgi:hypothetical protein
VKRARAMGLWACAWLVLGCTKEPGPVGADEAAGPPPANARAMLDEARRELADPDRMPLRQGMQIDQEGLRQALIRLRSQHGAQVAVAYQAEIDALPAGDPPAAERFVEVAAFVLPEEPAARDVEAINWLLDEDVRATTQRVLGTYVTLLMHRDVGMTTADIGIWMAFLRAAKPELRRCGEPGGTRLALCLDYGDDVFVLDVERQEPAWVVTRLRWMQARDE